MKKLMDISTIEMILSLIRKYKNDNLTSEELIYLNNWIGESEDNKRIFDQLLDDALIGNHLLELENIDVKKHQASIFRKIGLKKALFHIGYYKLAAACIIFAIIIIGARTVFDPNNKHYDNATTKGIPVSKAIKGSDDDILLTLSDGSTIALDKAKNGKIATQGSVDIINHNGRLSYINSATGKPVNGDNTVTIPNGRSFELILPDNTKVWLNSGSFIKYPVSFSEKDRIVTMSGEAYFEVTKDKQRPFIVMAHNAKIQVLGTHFNIKGYSNQEITKTTLLEGSVKINRLDGADGKMLKPGEQALIMPNERIKVVKEIDPIEVLAWKNNLFVFHDTDLKDILETISNWYGVKIYYKEQVDEKYTLTIDNSISLERLLKYLENSGGAHFKIEKDVIIVNH